ncbi:TMAO reductase system protein TorT [Labrys monachus]|uniref:Ribose transport system substrate-binding protein/inositol transport system substrate-binding protein n=1 Tax=Labrys monachus TaxID=217067 RepID=A0ABU0FA55_9HYPH|nr:TMAO reductase system protein TorT [Labrys monachus]MDQ0391416.1 ribose transport system substrate-binding protein/inositol transport system substrate-binding protein [Labrys monachus]
MKTFRRAAILAAALLSATAMSRAASAGETTIGIAVPNLASSFWISAVYGMEAEAKTAHVTIIKLNAGGDANTSQQISQIQDLIQRKVDAIVVGATNGDGVKAIVERAIAAGIPVVGISSPPNTPKLASVVSADHYGMGKLQAQCLAKAIGGKGNVAMMAGPSGQAWSDRRALGFKETLAAEAPAVKIVAESRLADNRNAALSTAEDWTQRFPDLAGVYAATDDMAAGIVSAFKEAGTPVHVSASNFSPTAQQMLKDGDIACTSIQEVVVQGRDALQQAVNAATKKQVEPQVVTPALLVTRDNMATVDLSSAVAPADYRP